MLHIQNLHAKTADTEILKGINLQVKPGEIHAIMGPNGAGKSTLGKVLAGHESYEVTQGSVDFNNQDLLDMDPEVRAREGVFLAFQYPVEIPGVTNLNFLRTAVNQIRVHRGEEELSIPDFIAYAREKEALVNMPKELAERNVNEGFSGGEKKRNELFQLAVLDPALAILDETDSGLDIDALRIVAEGVNKLRSEKRAFIIITHYQRLLDYIEPDFVHIMNEGKIVRSGDKELAKELEEKGYEEMVKEA